MSRAGLGAVAALVLVALDVAAVPATLPSARVELGASSSGLVWVQGAYLLALAVALIALGQVAARLDHPLRTAAGVTIVAAGTLLAASADATATLVAGRALQGAGSAPLLVASLQSLRGAPGGRKLRPTLFAATPLAALALAPLIGGAVAEEADWRWLFRLELLPAALALLLLVGSRSVSPSPEPAAPARAPALAAGIVVAAIGLIQSGPWDWASLDTLVLLGAGAILLWIAWRDGLGQADAAALSLAGCACAALLFVPQYFELVRGLSPLRSGLLAVAVTGPAAAVAPLGALLAGRLGSRLAAAGGLACAAAGAVGATRIDPASSYVVVILSLALLGTGAGAAAGALSREACAIRLVTPVAAGAALVVAAAGGLFQLAQADERDGGGSFEDALAAGMVGAAWLLAALLAAAAVVAWLRGPAPPRTGASPARRAGATRPRPGRPA